MREIGILPVETFISKIVLSEWLHPLSLQVCSAPLGMEDYIITSTQISASSQYDSYHAPNQGRLNFKKTGSWVGSWSARGNNVHQWFQVDLRIETTVTFLATQGRNMHGQWVTKYKLQYGNDGSTFRVFKQDGESSDKVSPDSKWIHQIWAKWQKEMTKA